MRPPRLPPATNDPHPSPDKPTSSMFPLNPLGGGISPSIGGGSARASAQGSLEGQPWPHRHLFQDQSKEHGEITALAWAPAVGDPARPVSPFVAWTSLQQVNIADVRGAPLKVGVDARPAVPAAVSGGSGGSAARAGGGAFSKDAEHARRREALDRFCPPRLAWLSSTRLAVGWGRRLRVLERQEASRSSSAGSPVAGTPQDSDAHSASSFRCVATAWMPSAIAGLARCSGHAGRGSAGQAARSDRLAVLLWNEGHG